MRGLGPRGNEQWSEDTCHVCRKRAHMRSRCSFSANGMETWLSTGNLRGCCTRCGGFHSSNHCVAIGAEPHFDDGTLRGLTGTDAQLVHDVVNYTLKNTEIIDTDLRHFAQAVGDCPDSNPDSDLDGSVVASFAGASYAGTARIASTASEVFGGATLLKQLTGQMRMQPTATLVPLTLI